MLILLPLFGFLGILANLRISNKEWGLRSLLLRSSILWAVVAVLMLEVLSLAGAISQLGLSLAWGGVLVLAAVGAFRARTHSVATIVPTVHLPREWFVRYCLAIVLAIGLVTLTVALVAPPNTWDSLTTHLSRVAHWAQERSLNHFATGIELQNLTSPGPSLLVLQGYVLSESDRFANLTDWSAMAISMIGVSLIAHQLGASRPGQALAAVFVATLPMGIAQASSTMTDYVVAWWMVCVAFETLEVRNRNRGILGAVPLGAAVGLAVLSKPTSFAYLGPFAVYAVIVIVREFGVSRLAKQALVASACVVAINLGYFSRNLAAYGNPIGTDERIAVHSNEVMNWRVATSNVLRNASLHAGTPWSGVNQQLYVALAKVHAKLELSMTDPRTSIHSEFQVFEPLTDENRAGNTAHAVLILISMPLLLWPVRGRPSLIAYSATVVLGFVALSVMIKFSIFASRYHLPFFILIAPLVGTLLASLRWRFTPWLVVSLLALLSWRWLVGIDNRPIIPSGEGQASIFTTPRKDLYLPERIGVTYATLSDMIVAAQCLKIGIMISGASPEYPFWVFLGAPRSDLEIEWIVGQSAPSAKYREATFQPCAIICQRCPEDWATARGLPLEIEERGFRLYLAAP